MRDANGWGDKNRKDAKANCFEDKIQSFSLLSINDIESGIKILVRVIEGTIIFFVKKKHFFQSVAAVQESQWNRYIRAWFSSFTPALFFTGFD